MDCLFSLGSALGSQGEVLHLEIPCLVSCRRPIYTCSHDHHQSQAKSITIKPKTLMVGPAQAPPYLYPELDPFHRTLLLSRFFHGSRNHLGIQEPESQTAPTSLQAQWLWASSGCPAPHTSLSYTWAVSQGFPTAQHTPRDGLGQLLCPASLSSSALWWSWCRTHNPTCKDLPSKGTDNIFYSISSFW